MLLNETRKKHPSNNNDTPSKINTSIQSDQSIFRDFRSVDIYSFGMIL